MSGLHSKRIVVVGCGQAGLQTAISLRQRGHIGPISMIECENTCAYQRPPLSKNFILSKADCSDLVIRKDGIYRDQNIERLTGRVASSIDRARKAVVLSDQCELAYDCLALATGASARPLAVQGSEHAYYLRGFEDALALRTAFRAAQKIAIVGGGYIGLELAASARKMGLEVTVLEAADRVLGRVVAPETSRFFAALHRERGVLIQLNTAISSIAKSQSGMLHVFCANGLQTEVDVVVAAVGAMPRTELADVANLDTEGGIVVDVRCRTSDQLIYAAGDCTSQPLQTTGRFARIESVQNAIAQGNQVAASILEMEPPAPDVPWFWSDQYDTKLQIAGLSIGYDRIEVHGEPGDGSFSVAYFRNGALIALDAINRPQDFVRARKAIGHSQHSLARENKATAISAQKWG
jgi:3-phenylpropionate/trans-cinnamate dioxygenase ferredoxin reductase subunit